MKKNCWLLLLLIFSNVSAQVGINTTLPLKPFHIDGKKDNPPVGTLTPGQESNDVVVDQDGNVGIGTISPQAKLDVRGDMTIEKKMKLVNAKDLGVNGVFPLYIDQSGTMGRIKPKDPKPFIVLNSFDERNNTAADYNNFNAGTKVVVSFKNQDNVLKKGDFAEIDGSFLKIKEDGYYSLSSALNLFIAYDAIFNGEKNAYILGDIAYKRNNGAWVSIISVREIQNVIETKGTSFQVVFPTIVTKLQANDLIRISYTRGKNSSGVEGDAMKSVYLKNDTNLGTNGFQLSIYKL